MEDADEDPAPDDCRPTAPNLCLTEPSQEPQDQPLQDLSPVEWNHLVEDLLDNPPPEEPPQNPSQAESHEPSQNPSLAVLNQPSQDLSAAEWSHLVDELLDIDVSPVGRRKSSCVSITFSPPPETVAPDDNLVDATDDDLLNDPNLLGVQFIADDPDSEVLVSEEEACEEEPSVEGSAEQSVDCVDSSEGVDIQSDDKVNSEDNPEDSPDSDTEDGLSDSLLLTRHLSEDYRAQSSEMCELVGRGDVAGIDSFLASRASDLGAVCLVSNAAGHTPVTEAAGCGSLAVLQQLCDAGVWLHCYDDAGQMAIHRAAELGREETVAWLCAQGQWTHHTRDGRSALHIAATNGHFTVVSTLLDFVSDVDETTMAGSGETALHLAAEHGHAAVTELLIGRGADRQRGDSAGMTVLHIAAAKGFTDVVDKVLLYTSRDGMDAQTPDTKKTALHLAVEAGYDQVACRLVEGGASVDVADKDGETPLHKLAAGYKQAGVRLTLPQECVLQLCAASKDIDKLSQRRRSALFVAAETGHPVAVGALLANGASPEVEISPGCGPLYAATLGGHCECVDTLLAAGARVDAQTDSGSTALYRAARAGQVAVVTVLLAHGARVDLPRKTGWTPLHVAAHRGRATVVEQLLAAGADICAADNHGQSPLAVAAYIQATGVVKVMRRSCRDPAAVYSVAKLGNAGIMAYLAGQGVSLDTANDLCGWRAIHHAAAQGDTVAVTTLGRTGAQLDAQDNDGNTALHLATLHGHHAAAQALLTACCYASVTNGRGNTAVCVAAMTGHTAILAALLAHGAAYDDPDTAGKSPLHYALTRGHTTAARTLIEHGAELTADHAEHICRHGDAAMLRLLASRGVAMEMRDDRGNTLLHTAATHGNLDVTLELVATRSALVHATNDLHQTAIHLAATEGHPLIVEALLSAGAKVSLMDADDCVSYEMAKHQAVWDVLKQWAELNPSMLEPASRESTVV